MGRATLTLRTAVSSDDKYLIMSTLPTAKERKVLEKLERLKHIHFVLLIVLICSAGLTFIFPNGLSPLATVLFGTSISCVGMSAMRLQYFQRCPRCSGRRSKGQVVCNACGLEYYALKTSPQEDE